MSESQSHDLRKALQDDEALAARFAAAADAEEVAAIAAEAGVELPAEALAEDQELSDAELETLSGGYTFPQTDWIYCDNPWTNYWCTLKC